MNESSDIAVLAIDGGGTRCRVACQMAGRIAQVETGPANVYSDFDGAVAQIGDALTALSAKTGLPERDLAALPAFVGLAGAIGEATTRRLKAALPFDRLRIADDRPAALRGALGTADGAILHCGTGSFLALQRAREIRLAGGWGAILGDEASARWIGCAALNAVLRVEDGTLSDSLWARELLHDMGGVTAILDFAAKASPRAFGALAPRVTQASAAGDPLARSILQRGAHYLAEALMALGWTEGMALCLTGGVAPHYKPHLPPQMAKAVRAPAGTPLDGALALAREVADVHR